MHLKKILEQCLKEKPLHTIKDWALYSGLNQRGLEQLAAAGAFDCFGMARRDALWEILSLKRQHPEELPLSYVTDEGESRIGSPGLAPGSVDNDSLDIPQGSGDDSSHGTPPLAVGSNERKPPETGRAGPSSNPPMSPKVTKATAEPQTGGPTRTTGTSSKHESHVTLSGVEGRRGPALPPMTVTEQLAADFRTKDLSTGPHPMSLVRDRLKEAGICASADLKEVPPNRVVRIAGVVTIRQRPMTAKGFMFITLEDETGFSNIVVKPQMLERFRKEIVFHSGLIVKGLLEKNDGVINVIGHHFEPLEIDDKDISIRSRDFR